MNFFEGSTLVDLAVNHKNIHFSKMVLIQYIQHVLTPLVIYIKVAIYTTKDKVWLKFSIIETEQ